jgi:hypothetical protein
MDKDLTAPLRDEIGLAIEAAMSVTPDPSLAAHVRARVDLERTKPIRWRGWQLAVGAACVAMVAAVVPALWPRDRNAADPAPMLAASHPFHVVPYATPAEPPPLLIAHRAQPNGLSRGSADAATSRAAAPRLSPDAAALRGYVAYLRQVRNDGPMAEAVQPASGPLELPTITIARIAIDPLPRLEAVTGERQ